MWLCGYCELCASRLVGERLLISRSNIELSGKRIITKGHSEVGQGFWEFRISWVLVVTCWYHSTTLSSPLSAHQKKAWSLGEKCEKMKDKLKSCWSSLDKTKGSRSQGWGVSISWIPKTMEIFVFRRLEHGDAGIVERTGNFELPFSFNVLVKIS